jgi:hypothetical protein
MAAVAKKRQTTIGGDPSPAAAAAGLKRSNSATTVSKPSRATSEGRQPTELTGFLPPRTGSETIMTAAVVDQLQREGYAVVDIGMEPEKCAAMLDALWQHAQILDKRIVRGDPSTYHAWAGTTHWIFQHHGAGQNRAVWELRQSAQVVLAFSELWGVPVEQLLSSMDGFCLAPAGRPQMQDATILGEQRLNKTWTHCDQSNRWHGCYSIQGFVDLVGNEADGDGGLVVYPMSHLCHSKVWASLGHDSPDHWCKFEPEQLAVVRADCRPYLPDDHALKNSPEPVPLTPLRVRARRGQLVLWDSRTFHRNVTPQLGSYTNKPGLVDRAVIYTCLLPRRNLGLSDQKLQQLLAKRVQWMKDERTTNHWGTKPFAKKPRDYGKPRELCSASSLLLHDPSELSAIGRVLLGLQPDQESE